ncbi:MAG: hypothetical protein CVV63_04400 [Tenericutes bacterium HGW-Tenericutes-8]|jgi:uncharacterized protein with PQ loop repeat|nr:MAG: hypothetical protein CVV63_04400 [Tenericutes bacterium HGW-Tenericutes-8]
MDQAVIETIGILAGALVLVSFLMKGERKIRLINIVGATIFIGYGILINSISVTLLNTGLVLVHIYFLRKKA